MPSVQSNDSTIQRLAMIHVFCSAPRPQLFGPKEAIRAITIATLANGFPRLPIIRSDKRTPSTVVDAFDETPTVLEVINIKVFLLSLQETRSAKPSQAKIE